MTSSTLSSQVTAPGTPKRRLARWLGGYSALVYVFLYLPMAIIVLFSFNAGRSTAEFTGFSIDWYVQAWTNSFLVEALYNSLVIATTSATLATVFGTMAALALQRVRGPLRMVFDLLTQVAILIPGIVIGIATLVFFVQSLDWLNGWINYLWPSPGPVPVIGLGRVSVIAAHSLFTMAIVILLVRARIAGMDRSMIDASADLFATPWGTFRQITLPHLFPAVLAAFLLSFTLSFDDFIIAFFVAGPQNTLPLYIFSSIRRGVTPEINAVASSILIATLAVLLFGQWLLRRRAASAPDVQH